ncbi:hypothetical protein [Nocardioides sp. W7]|uniref:hypothetical protein n=1 Tax=Nocardioides sp. W7 TaxID=2931390 RepID=UPI001FD37492|nr:hypothetical protein [Nocardioides sp. W7]
MNARRHGLVALATVAALVLAGCGGDDPAAPEPDLQITADGADAANTLTSAETRFFSDSSPWNTRADDLTVDPDSVAMMDLAQERIGVVENGDRIRTEPRRITDPVYINTEAWTTPVVAGGKPTPVVCRQIVCGDGEASMVLDVPTDVDPDPRYDGWYTIFDPSKSIAYDLWRARREDDGSISYHFMRIWELEGEGFSDPQVVGARGSGLPLFAGLIRPGELNAGRIEHALAISVPGPAQSSFVQPASSTDGNGRPQSLPEGARIRLKADVTMADPVDPVTGEPIPMTDQQRRYADAIALALRTYGAIVVDRAAVPTLYAQRDVTGDMLRGNELQGLHLDDFEVVQLGTRYQYPPDEADAGDGARATPGTPSATPTTTEGAP